MNVTDYKMMGVIFSNMHDDSMGDLTELRTVGSIPYGGRYRLIDFTLSNMVNSGITDVGVITKLNYQSLLDHLGAGRAWDLSRKRGGLVILPPFSRTVAGGAAGIYRGSIEALAGRLDYLRSVDARYVCLSDCDVITNLDFKDVLARHVETGADITVLYANMEMRPASRDLAALETGPDSRVLDVTLNPREGGSMKVYLNMVVLNRELLIKLVESCYTHGEYSFTQDVLQKRLRDFHICGYEVRDFCVRVSDMQSYFAANMALLNPEARAQLFPPERPVFTKVRDEVPAKYGLKAQVENSLVADGCVIDGRVENSVVGRGVRIGRGAVVKNSILMQGTIVGEGADLNYVVTDKNVVVRTGRALCGYTTIPVYLQKGFSV